MRAPVYTQPLASSCPGSLARFTVSRFNHLFDFPPPFPMALLSLPLSLSLSFTHSLSLRFYSNFSLRFHCTIHLCRPLCSLHIFVLPITHTCSFSFALSRSPYFSRRPDLVVRPVLSASLSSSLFFLLSLSLFFFLLFGSSSLSRKGIFEY